MASGRSTSAVSSWGGSTNATTSSEPNSVTHVAGLFCYLSSRLHNRSKPARRPSRPERTITNQVVAKPITYTTIPLHSHNGMARCVFRKYRHCSFPGSPGVPAKRITPTTVVCTASATADIQDRCCFSNHPTTPHHTGAENRPMNGINDRGAANIANGR